VIIAPTIRSRFSLLIALSVIFWFICALVLTDRINRIIRLDQSAREIVNLKFRISELIRESTSLRNQFQYISSDNIHVLQSDKIEKICKDAANSLAFLNDGSLITENPVIQKYLNNASEDLSEIVLLSDKYSLLINERGDLESGLIKQWYQRLTSVKQLPLSGTSRSAVFLNSICSFADAYLMTRDPSNLDKLTDYWQMERNLLLPYNSAGPETESLLEEFLNLTKHLSELNRKAGYNNESGLNAEILMHLLQVMETAENLDKEYGSLLQASTGRIKINFIWFVLLFGGIAIAVFYGSLKMITKSVAQLRLFVYELKSGKIPGKLSLKTSDDLTEIAQNLNDLADSLNRKVQFADQIGESMIQSDFQPEGEEDVLGNSLLKMAGRLREAENEDSIHKSQEEKRRWLSEGIAQFGEIFRSERENVQELAFNVIKNLVKYINADLGAVYLTGESDGSPVLELVSAFAYDRRKYISRRISYGEGLIGTCALEKETIYLTEIPENYFEITSGIGKALPRCLLIVPLKLEKELFGILEIASFHILAPHETGFVEQLGESIANTLSAVRSNERTVRLLEKSQKQAEEMALQEEKMIRNMQELQKAQEESRRKESEITGILNAVNSSSLVAEYSTGGRFSDINEKFLFLLESPRDQVIGKHHSDFAAVDKYSAEYKDFWKRLREGETIIQAEHFRLFSGNEIWLNQTYTPILDKDGRPYKILNIAHDITQARKQQESLEKQAHEIHLRNLEIQNLGQAVDASIIKCELSSDGIITNVNDNYINSTGYSRKEVLGKNLRLFLKDIEKQQFEKIWAEVLKEKTYSGVIRRTKPAGEEVWLMSTFTPVKSEEGEISKAFFLAHDITEKKLKYQLLEDANREIDRLRQLLHDSDNH
jgi:PAS domain S-box-containing protein